MSGASEALGGPARRLRVAGDPLPVETPETDVSAIPPEGPHRVDSTEIFKGVTLSQSIIDSRQAVEFRPHSMPDLVLQQTIEDGARVRPYIKRGVTAHIRFIVETGTSESAAAANGLSEETVAKDLESQATVMLPPLALANGKKQLETRLVGMIRNEHIGEQPLGAQLTTEKEVLAYALGMLGTARDKPEVMFGEPEFFERPEEHYGVSVVGPNEDEGDRLFAAVYGEPDQTPQVVPLKDPEVRRHIGTGRLALAALALLSHDGTLEWMGPNVGRSADQSSPYPCMLILTREELPPTPIDEDLAEGLQAIFSVPDIPASSTDRIPSSIPTEQEPETAPITTEDDDNSPFFRPTQGFFDLLESGQRPSIGLSDDMPYGMRLPPQKSRLFHRRGL